MTESSPPSMEQSEATSSRDTKPVTTTKCTQEMLENTTLVTQFGKEDTAAESQSHAARTQDTLVNLPWRTPKSPKSSACSVSRIDTSQSYRDEGIRRD